MMSAQGNSAQRRANEAALGEVLRRELKTALDSTREALFQQAAETRETLLQQGAETRETLLQQELEHHAAVIARLDEIQTTLSALANGSIQLGIQGMAFFGGSPIAAAVNSPARHVPVTFPTS
jgi:DNA-binding protein H-NS